jgi:transcriptional regulator with XRE-family HTH domain
MSRHELHSLPTSERWLVLGTSSTLETIDMQRPMTLGRAIRDARRAKGWTQEALALKIDDGLTQSDVSRLERDKVSLPRRDRLERIAGALGIPTGELLASSGWAEADRFFRPSSPGDGTSPEDRSAQSASLLPSAPGSSTAGRLHEALAHSRALQAQTDQLLQRSRSAVRYWEGSLQRQETEIESKSACGDS